MINKVDNMFYDFEVRDKIIERTKTHNEKQNLLSLITQYNNYDYFCFVEGSDDPYFYYNNKKELFNNALFRTFWLHNSDNWKGKDGVLSMFYSIAKLSEKGKPNMFFPKCIFIVDHDYAGAKSMGIEVDDMTSKKITVTKGYSFENYFLNDDNIVSIFNYFDLSDKDCEKFKKKYKEFHDSLYEFTRCKASIVLVKTIGNKWYDADAKWYSTKNFNTNKKIDLSNDIFKFSFTADNYSENYFNKTTFSNELKKMYDYLNNNKNRKAKECYNEDSKAIALDINFIRGHEAFNFLTQYLYDVHNIVFPNKWTKEYYDIVSKLNVDITVVNGKGQRIN